MFNLDWKVIAAGVVGVIVLVEYARKKGGDAVQAVASAPYAAANSIVETVTGEKGITLGTVIGDLADWWTGRDELITNSTPADDTQSGILARAGEFFDNVTSF